MTRRTLGLLALSIALGARLVAEEFPYLARVIEIEDLTHDTKRIRFRLPEASGFRFTPGQYTFLKVPDEFVAEWNQRYQTGHKRIARPYSFASSASRLPSFDLIIKLAAPPPGKDVPPGVASTYVHSRLKVGDEVRFSAPAGTLHLRKDTGRPIIIVAGGTGMAPFLSLLEYWFENQFEKNNDIYLFFGVRSKRDLFYDDRFRAWEKEKKLRYFPALSHPEPEDRWQGETGFIQTIVDKHIPAPSDADAYLAGPPIMVQETVKVLHSKGITKDRIHYDQIVVR
jgi:Na+-transporting NADH:ubiquinone oxidoreductase subunit F